MITETDLKLISALEKDGRASYAQLSRSLGISISTVAKKCKYLLDDRVINIRGVINPSRLGLNAQAFVAIRTTAGNLEDVCKLLEQYPNVELVIALFGRFNLIVSIHFGNWDGLHNFISSEISAISDISDMEIFFIKENKRRFYSVPAINYTGASFKIDRIDKQIINELCSDGRSSVSDLANKLGLSISSISKRLSRLYDENAIQVRAMVNHARIGKHASAFIFMRAQHSRIENICETITSFEEISTIITLINGYDIFLNVVCNDSESLYHLVNNKIASIPGVIDIETWPRGKVFKRYYGPLPVK